MMRWCSSPRPISLKLPLTVVLSRGDRTVAETIASHFGGLVAQGLVRLLPMA